MCQAGAGTRDTIARTYRFKEGLAVDHRLNQDFNLQGVLTSGDAMDEMLRALRWRLSKPKQILFVAKSRAEAQQLASAVRASYVPQRIIAVAAEADIPTLAPTIPLFEEKVAIGGRPTAYVCEERICKLPAFDAETLVGLLD